MRCCELVELSGPLLLLLLQRRVDHTLLSSGGGPHSAPALLTYANITLLSHLLNYVSRIDAFLAT